MGHHWHDIFYGGKWGLMIIGFIVTEGQLRGIVAFFSIIAAITTVIRNIREIRKKDKDGRI